MPIYSIAGLNIKINPVCPQTEKRLLPYICGAQNFDFDVSSSQAEIDEYKKKFDVTYSSHIAENSILLTKISRTVLESYNGCFFHSSCLELDGEAYMFTAASGVGKSTHTRLWREYFGDRITMINDDKPLIRKIDGIYCVCGTPWMGKSDIGCNMISPIKAVYVLKRGRENHAVTVSPGKVIRQLMEATLLPENRENMIKLLSLFDDLFNNVKLIELHCNTNIDAAKIAFDAAQ